MNVKPKRGNKIVRGFEQITMSEILIIYNLGFSAEVDGDRKEVRIWKP